MIENIVPAVFVDIITTALNIRPIQVQNTIKLLDEGATIPFISRYRKEATDNLDELQIAAIKDQYEALLEMQKRKETILKTISSINKLTPELEYRIAECWNETELEDIYLPYKPKRRTKAEIARENGLEPLAKIIMKQHLADPEKAAMAFLNQKIITVDDAIKGASDIIAEWVNESELARNVVRKSFDYDGIIKASVIKGKEEDAQKYRDYFSVSEKLSKCSSHRLLAIRRAEAEGLLRISIEPDELRCLDRLKNIFCKAENESTKIVSAAVKDAFKRLLKPSIENEFAAITKAKADLEAIRVFSSNLKQLLLASPLGEKRILAIDPGFRTGCKVVCLDNQGVLLHNETIYPHPPQNEYNNAVRKIQKLVEAYQIEAIAIGNGTAGRETEHLIQNIRYDRKIQVFVVSENGASVYSASKVARDEFPNYDVTVRGAVSIGRRLMDPLAELVKIDAKSIGVGQYQHDVDQHLLKKSLDQTVINVVNRVGVNLNTASKHLLAYVSGLGLQLAQNVIEYRNENGPFENRKQLLQVKKMGLKTYEQCAGFLRIANALNPLDNSAVHPESYNIIEKFAADLSLSVNDLMGNSEILKKIELKRYITDNVGLPTLNDIIQELEKPGRDPRQSAKIIEFDSRIRKISDLNIGMDLPGIVTNITNFGVFVYIGIKENGLIHISQLADKFVSNPSEIVSLNQHIRVQVVSIDLERNRIQLKKLPD